MKGQMTFINLVIMLLTLLFISYVTYIYFPILDDILLPNLQQADDANMGYNLASIIFPILLILVVIAIIWIVKPFIPLGE